MKASLSSDLFYQIMIETTSNKQKANIIPEFIKLGIILWAAVSKTVSGGKTNHQGGYQDIAEEQNQGAADRRQSLHIEFHKEKHGSPSRIPRSANEMGSMVFASMVQDAAVMAVVSGILWNANANKQN